MENRPESPWVLERIGIGVITRLHEGLTTIGRSPTSTLTVASDYVSRTHAEFQITPGSADIQIRDLGSTNGIFVNDKLYKRTSCRLQVGDRIGIGVSIDDDQITSDGKYPLFILRHEPAVEVIHLVEELNEIPFNNAEELHAEIAQPPQILVENDEEQPEKNMQLGISDNEYDEDDDEDDFVQPQCLNILENEKSITMAPPSSAARNIVSENIRSIFGELNPELLSNLSKDVRKIAEASTTNQIPSAIKNDVICISSDEEEDEIQRDTVRSPDLFSDSFSKNENATNIKKENEEVVETPEKNISTYNSTEKSKQEPDASLKFDDVDENEEEELYFTQSLLADIRAELPDSDTEITPDYPADGSRVVAQSVKQEEYVISDDDEYDEELESKVKDWSIKLFSQTYNASQVYEDDLGNAPATTTDTIFINIDDDDDNDDNDEEEGTAGGERYIKKEPDIDEPVSEPIVSVRIHIPSSSSDREENEPNKEVSEPIVPGDVTESPLIKQWQQCSSKQFLFSSSSDEENYVEKAVPTHKSKSVSSSKKRHGKETHVRKLSITNEIPQKKPRLSSRSEENDKEETIDRRARRESSSSLKTYSKESSEKRDTKTLRGPPEIITPPQLPTNRGKLRGVSAVQQRCMETLKALSNKKDLKRKWKEKPSIAKRKEQDLCKAIKEDRKQKLKELADKKSSDLINTKNKANIKKHDHRKAVSKNPKIKVTSVNRGAFLTKDMPSVCMKSYKIPKTKLARSSSTSSETTSLPKPSSSTTIKSTTLANTIDKRKSSTEVLKSFSMELLKADEIHRISVKQTRVNTYRDRQKSIDVQADQKERAPPRRSNKKLTFEAMEQHFAENSRLHDYREKSSDMESQFKKQKKKKTVRFNDVLEIHFIEPVLSVTRRIYKKEPFKFTERKNMIRTRFPLVDHTEDLLSDMLSWSQHWLENKQINPNTDGSDGMVFPISNEFTSIGHYKSIVFPLLKIEYLAILNRHMQKYSTTPGYNIRIDYFTPYRDREIMFAKCSSPINKADLGSSDLALIDVVGANERSQFFGFIEHIRRADSCNTITINITKNAIVKEHLKVAKQVTIRRIIQSIRTHFGAYNAIYQLEQTPLFEKILNPLDLLNVKTNWRPSIQYRSCDPLNDEQKEILLKIYAKTIDECNPNISLIKGPPGTGKSRLIANLALQLLYGNEVRMLDKKILICAQSNMAVDVIAHRLYAMQKKIKSQAKKFTVIRFGRAEKVHKDVRDIMLSKIIERGQARLHERNESHDQTTINENLKNEILKLEAKIAKMQKENLQDVRQDELIELQRNLALKKSVHNQTLRPEDEKRLSTFYLESANIVCATLSSCVSLLHYTDYFDVCIIDEATQCIEPWSLMPLTFGVTSLILVGDTQQLPATVISQKAKDYGLGTSLFTRIQNCLENNNSEKPSPIFSLHTQYRMHPEICKWPNMYFYQNQLINSPNTAEFKSHIKPFSILNLEYRQNEFCHNGRISNSLEAEFVTKLVIALNLYIPNKFFSYGVITPYAQHREKLEVMIRNSGLPNVMVNTIDSYQGIEKDVIIISNARTQGIGFLSDYQRLNVALTRPKKCLILCGNFKNLESVSSWASLLANARERGLFHDISPDDALDIDSNVIVKIKIKR